MTSESTFQERSRQVSTKRTRSGLRSAGSSTRADTSFQSIASTPRDAHTCGTRQLLQRTREGTSSRKSDTSTARDEHRKQKV